MHPELVIYNVTAKPIIQLLLNQQFQIYKGIDIYKIKADTVAGRIMENVRR